MSSVKLVMLIRQLKKRKATKPGVGTVYGPKGNYIVHPALVHYRTNTMSFDAMVPGSKAEGTTHNFKVYKKGLKEATL